VILLQLQIAFDRMPIARAAEITRAVASIADWIEVGTSLIKTGGVRAIEQIVEAAGSTPVLADLKTVDDAAYEFGLIFDAGAKAGTVLALAADASIERASSVASDRGGEVLVDLMLAGPDRAAALASRMGPEAMLLVHVGKDTGSSGPDPLSSVGAWAGGRRIAVAGGLTLSSLESLRSHPGSRAIVGSAITGAGDPVEAALAFRAAADGEKEQSE
jgi:3-hexulose-6-phosphate synthase